MLSQYERWIHFHSLYIKSAPDHAPLFSLVDLVPKIKVAINNAETIMLMDNETASLRIADIDYPAHRKHIKLLIQYANKDATDPVFLDFEKKKLRTVHKLDGEGIAVSGHVIIGCTPNTDGTYPLLVEEVPGLGRTNIQRFLRWLFKLVSEGHFIFNDETDNNKSKKYRPVAEVMDDPSSSFSNDLQAGTIEGIELVKRMPRGNGDFDEAGFFVEDITIIKVKVVNKQVKGIMGHLNDLKKKAKNKGFSDIKIRYNKLAGKRKTAVMGTNMDDIASACVVRTEMVESLKPLAQCSDKLNKDFANKIASYL
jgi:hypothetical protein